MGILRVVPPVKWSNKVKSHFVTEKQMKSDEPYGGWGNWEGLPEEVTSESGFNG